MTANLLPRVLRGILAPGTCDHPCMTAVLVQKEPLVSSRLHLDTTWAIAFGSCTISAHKVLSMHQFVHQQAGSPIGVSPPEASCLGCSFASGTVAALPGSANFARLRIGILCFAAELWNALATADPCLHGHIAPTEPPGCGHAVATGVLKPLQTKPRWHPLAFRPAHQTLLLDSGAQI